MATLLALLGPHVQPLVAVVVERLLGYPAWLYGVVGHPVTWIGNLISTMDEKLNTTAHVKSLSRLNGILAVVLLCAAVWFAAACVDVICNAFAYGHILSALFATTLLAQKSLRDHVRDVGRGLSTSLTEGRAAVAKIVGRDTRGLNVSDVVKAALESLAENTADGVVAPLFWYCVGCLTIGGLPAIAIYKAINTADSMIGHKTPQYLHFGWAAARLDDLVNLPASRLTAILFILASGPEKMTHVHRSPNAGWPEASMAAALGFKFGGPRTYGGEFVKLPYMGEGRDNFLRQDIDAGLKLYDRTLWLLLALTALFALIP
jgi:adenosylcobinamide-phosphate synthase